MISSRRQVVNEQDRYGGYNRQPVARVSIDEPLKSELNSPINFTTEKRKSGIEVPGHEYTLMRPEDTVNYSVRQNEYKQDFPQTSEYIGLYDTPKKNVKYQPSSKVKQVKREREDVMPSIRTKAYVLNEDEITKREKKEAVDLRTKVILSVYVAVVVVLAAIVIATGIAVSGLSENVSSLEHQLALKNEIVIQQQHQLDKISDETYMKGLAVENDMVKLENTNTVELTEEISPTVYESRTNWFDKLCDTLSKLIGG